MRNSNRGFSLIEMLIVLGVIGLLVAIVLPALGKARSFARQAKSLSNLRGIAATVEQYVSTYDSYPFGASGPSLPPETGEPYVLGYNIWFIDRFWPVLMHDVAPWPSHYESWLSPGRERSAQRLWQSGLRASTDIAPSYRYSTSFIGSPQLWDGRLMADRSLVRAVKPGAVAFPSAKALMYDHDRAYLSRPPRDGDPRPVLAADGAAAMRLDRAASAPVQNPFHNQPPRIYHDTAMGVAGRDF